jgi:thiamine monophosphate synthase
VEATKQIMSEEEAIILLTSCKRLAQQLVATDCNYSLSVADRKALRGLRRVRQAQLIVNERIRLAAGLTTEEMVVLIGTLLLHEWSIV